MGVHIRIKKKRLIYLDVIHKGWRRWEPTGLTISPDPLQTREVMRIAEAIRSKREQQLASGDWGLIDPVRGKQALIDYAEDLAHDQDPKNPLPSRSGTFVGSRAASISRRSMRSFLMPIGSIW